jgi:lysophospholipid acyltransferase (LPLAT)-like uncharacterized protein
MKLRLDHPAWARLGPALARGLIRIIFGTSRKTLHGDAAGKALFQSEAPVIFALWHGQLLTTIYLGQMFGRLKPAIVIMASPSRDGRFIGEVARGLGLPVCPGSSQKGGFLALRQMTGLLRQGFSVGLAADGSRGPAHVAQKGVLYLARETQRPILPFVAANRRKFTLNTWDNFEVPLPFGHHALLVDAPLWVGPEERGDALERRRQDLEARLNILFRRSQEFF